MWSPQSLFVRSETAQSHNLAQLDAVTASTVFLLHKYLRRPGPHTTEAMQAALAEHVSEYRCVRRMLCFFARTHCTEDAFYLRFQRLPTGRATILRRWWRTDDDWVVCRRVYAFWGVVGWPRHRA